MIIKRPLSHGASNNDPKQGIIHCMAEYLYHEGKWRHAVEFLDMMGWSAHAFGCPDGSIIECREVVQGAYHAKGHNRGTLGYEYLVEGRHDYVGWKEIIKSPYLKEGQLEAGTGYIRERWVEGLGILNYRKHSDVSPERKVDPGKGFPWTKFLQNIGVIWRG